MPLKNPVHGARVSIWLMLIRLSEPDERRRMASPQPIPWEVRGCTKRPSQYSAPSPRTHYTELAAILEDCSKTDVAARDSSWHPDGSVADAPLYSRIVPRCG
jgi:hypothetical protein